MFGVRAGPAYKVLAGTNRTPSTGEENKIIEKIFDEDFFASFTLF